MSDDLTGAWTRQDTLEFWKHVNRQTKRADPVHQLARMLLMNDIGVGITFCEGSYGVVLVLDDWYDTRDEAADMAEVWQPIIEKLRQALDDRDGEDER